MPLLVGAVIVISLIIFSIGSYVIWPSRWNLPAHMQLGFAVTAYVIPIFGSTALESYPSDLVNTYAGILSVGAASYLLGLILGNKTPLIKLVSTPFSFRALSGERFSKFVSRRAAWLTVLALIGVAVSFAVMGFIPMFAADPLAAKFFRGAYQEPYARAALLFRWSTFMLYAIIPIVFTVWYVTKRTKFLVLGLASILALALTLTREPAVSGLLLFMGLVAANHRKWFKGYIALIITIYSLGSVAYYLMGRFMGFNGLLGMYASNNVFDLISSGSPDISDHLMFLGHFLEYGAFTYGRTFWGGLIPGHYLWNPSVWTLSVVSPTADLNDLVSGGLRLPVALWGYASFGWLGVVFVPLVSGLLWGNATRFARRYVGSESLLQTMVVLTVCMTIGSQLERFYALSIYSLPQILVALLLIYGVSAGTSRQRVGPGANESPVRP